MYARAGASAVKVRLAAVGTPALRITSLANALDDSMRAAAAPGPNTGRPAGGARSRSASPAASGASGPTTTRSILLPRGHDELVRGRRGDLEVGAELRGAGVAGGGEQGGLGGVALQRPGERVLAAAPPDDQ